MIITITEVDKFKEKMENRMYYQDKRILQLEDEVQDQKYELLKLRDEIKFIKRGVS